MSEEKYQEFLKTAELDLKNTNKKALVDIDKLADLKTKKWTTMLGHGNNLYVRTTIKTKTVYLHRYLLKAKKGKIVDHINGNTLDNRLCNLRIVTAEQSNRNKGLLKVNKSGYTGVQYHKGTGKWRATTLKKGKRISLGLYFDAKDAAKAYKQWLEENYKKYYRKSQYENIK